MDVIEKKHVKVFKALRDKINKTRHTTDEENLFIKAMVPKEYGN